ncbi:MAG: hypothetical protein BGP23_09980 [Lysobacterales bacterium 66-474]|nr:MAG: hypothetical protein BGP23_09980 [Xanthomonadales bacterium 66-474]
MSGFARNLVDAMAPYRINVEDRCTRVIKLLDREKLAVLRGPGEANLDDIIDTEIWLSASNVDQLFRTESRGEAKVSARSREATVIPE